ncbi:MAG TPA: iron-containing alcohol dehydrogenase [Deltaproteobacteria bacterium]|nr:iron-containing alcohol dehydrogenase [Deltaproteobacteria bacterium]HPJ95270.1 iron-containing alcohol dehydrogenase [Deltaproteobacteria bacterium]HPR51473.1 iron-containing alcohol dehydrogenase [Deltaproteobacteria bacterium]
MKYLEYEFDPFFTWVNRPKIMYGPGLRSEIGFELNQLGGTRALVVTDKGLVNAGVAKMVTDAIEASGDLELAGVFDEVMQDARIGIINKGAAFYRECKADCIVAVGGGSVMDSAKAINILIDAEADDFGPFAAQLGLYDGARQLPPHIALPTTAGTGCEVTYAMVVLDEENHAKLGVAHPFCNADIAMLDPELMVKLPPKITAFTGIDALTHAIEGATALTREPIADAMCLHAIRLVCKFLPLAVKEPDNISARGHMLMASNLAGMGFINALTGGVHATAHALGGIYGIPHGLANSIMLPWVMEFNSEEDPERFVMVADAMGIDTKDKDPADVAKEAVQAVRDLIKEIGLTETLRDFNVPAEREQLTALVELAYSDSQAPYNPRELTEDAIFDLYLKAI